MRSLKRFLLFVSVAASGCMGGGAQGVAQQAVAGPGGVTVTAPVDGQLAVSWAPDADAFKYYVYQSANGGTFSLVDIAIGPTMLPPAPTSFTATLLAGGSQYCYRIQSAYIDQSTSDLGPQGCGTATGNGDGGSFTRTLTVSPVGFASSTWSFIVGPNAMLSQSSGILVGGIPVHSGDRIASISFRSRGSGLVGVFKLSDATMAETVIGSRSVDLSTDWQTTTLPMSNVVAPGDGGLHAIFTANASGATLGGISVHYTPGQ